MKILRTTPLVVFAAMSLLTACEKIGGSTNNSEVGEQQKPISPAKPSE